MTEATLLSFHLCWDMHVAVPRGKDVQFRLQNKLSFTLHTFVFVTPHVVIRLVFNPIIARQAWWEKCIKPRQRGMVKFLKRQRTILALLCYTTSMLPLLARYAVKLFTSKKYFNRSVLNSQRHNFLRLTVQKFKFKFFNILFFPQVLWLYGKPKYVSISIVVQIIEGKFLFNVILITFSVELICQIIVCSLG